MTGTVLAPIDRTGLRNTGTNVTIGGNSAGDGNLISGAGIYGLGDNGTSLVVHGNFIGVDVTGGVALPNGNSGVFVGTGTGSQIGGPGVGEGNLVSGNGTHGVVALPGASGVVVQGNRIGTTLDGTGPIPNDRGISIEAPTSQVGGAGLGEGNLVSGNTTYGIAVRGAAATGVTIDGNSVGLDAAGTGALPNGIGVRIVTTTGTSVGGAAANVISGNVTGISLVGGTSGATISNNVIGLDASQTISVPNSGDGVVLASDAGSGNSILANSIATNGGLGIEIAPSGVTANDAGDGDAGPNDLLNFPVPATASVTPGTVTVNFGLDVPAGDYRVEAFTNPSGADPSGNGEGEVFAGATTITHTGSGVESFSLTYAGAAGDLISLTATEDLGGANFGSTSEFSAVITANAAPTFTGDLLDRH